MLCVPIELRLFTTRQPTDQPFDRVLKEIVLGLVESTSKQDEFVSKLHFLLATKFMSEMIR
jgi:hypothetical protein